MHKDTDSVLILREGERKGRKKEGGEMEAGKKKRKRER